MNGKFGSKLYSRKRIEYIEDGEVKAKITPLEKMTPYYLPIACFITAYARDDIVRTSQKIREYSLNKYGEDYYIYSDTDSCHIKYLSDDELKSFLDIDSYRLGAWDKELEFERGRFLRQKCYIEEIKDKEGNLKIKSTIAGLPKRMGKYVNFDNFKEGFQILANDITKDEKKLTYKHCKGGVVLVETDFTIK